MTARTSYSPAARRVLAAIAAHEGTHHEAMEFSAVHEATKIPWAELRGIVVGLWQAGALTWHTGTDGADSTLSLGARP